MWKHSILSRFFGAIGGAVVFIGALLIIALTCLIFLENVSVLFQNQVLIPVGSSGALCGALFPNAMKSIGKVVLTYLPYSI